MSKEKVIEKSDEEMVVEEPKKEVKKKLTKTEKLEKKIQELEKQFSEINEKMLRDRAELENFKKRINDEKIKERKYAQQYILNKLIDLNDNFERALSVKNYETVEKLKEGVVILNNLLSQILEAESVNKIDAYLKPFDPNYHQAVATDNIDKLADDVVSEVLQAGYLYKDRVLRPSMVKVNKKGE